MYLIDFVEVLVPIGLSLTNLEAIEFCTSLLIVLELFHQFLRSPGDEKVGYPQDVSIHIAVFTIVQQIDALLQHGGVLRQRFLVGIIHCIAQITVVLEPNDPVVTALMFVFHEHYTT